MIAYLTPQTFLLYTCDLSIHHHKAQHPNPRTLILYKWDIWEYLHSLDLPLSLLDEQFVQLVLNPICPVEYHREL